MFDMLVVALNVFITFEFNPLSANRIKWSNILNSPAVADKLFECVCIICIKYYIYIHTYIYTNFECLLYKCQIYINNSRGHICIHIYMYIYIYIYICIDESKDKRKLYSLKE